MLVHPRNILAFARVRQLWWTCSLAMCDQAQGEELVLGELDVMRHLLAKSVSAPPTFAT